MTQLKTPLAVDKYSNDTFYIRDKDNAVVGFHLTKDEADEIVTACNAHYILLELAAWG